VQPQVALPAVEDAPVLNEVQMEDAPVVNEFEMEDAPVADDEVLEDAPADIQTQGDASAALPSDNAIGQAIPEPIDTDMADAPAADNTNSEQDAEGEQDVCPYCNGPLLLDPLFCNEHPCPKECVRMFSSQFCFADAHTDHSAAGPSQQNVQQPVQPTPDVEDVDMEDQAAEQAVWDADLLALAEDSDVESVAGAPVGQDEQEDQDETGSYHAGYDNGNPSQEQDEDQDSEQDDEQGPGPHNYYGNTSRSGNRSPYFAQSDDEADGAGGYNGTYMADDDSRHGSRAPSFAASVDETDAADGAAASNATATADYQNNQTDATFAEFLDRNPPSPPKSPPQSPPKSPPQSAKRKSGSKPESGEGPSTAPVTRGPERPGVEYGTSNKTGRAIVIPRRKNRGNVDLSALQSSGIVVAGPSSIGGTSASPYYLPAVPSTNGSALPSNPATSTDYPEDQLPPPRSLTVTQANRARARQEAAEAAEQARLDLLEMQKLVDGELDEPESTDPAGPSTLPNTTSDDQIDPALLDAFGLSGTSGPTTTIGSSSRTPSSYSGADPNTPVTFDGIEGEYLPAKGRDEDEDM